MNKILIALDYAPGAQKVAEAGFSFAKAMKAEIILLHVVADPVYYSSSVYSPIMGFGGFMDVDFMLPDSINQLNKLSHDFLDQTRRHLQDGTIETIVKEGNTADNILETASEIHAGIIVMGNHSKKWLESVILGGTAQEVLRRTTWPLLLIPSLKENIF